VHVEGALVAEAQAQDGAVFSPIEHHVLSALCDVLEDNSMDVDMLEQCSVHLWHSLNVSKAPFTTAPTERNMAACDAQGKKKQSH
jgi:hypothetical protein